MERSSSTDKVQPLLSAKSGKGVQITTDVYCYTNQIVNVYFIGNPAKSKEWILVDAGMPGSADTLLSEAATRFGDDHQLKAIILTHGHFDHVGGLVGILERYKVPVYAHPGEHPFLSGKQDYPEPDSHVEGGMVAKLSATFPHEAIDISEVLQPLPGDGSVPLLPEWKWYHTPGHSPGHISLFRESDRFLIAGDAFVTVKQDSLYKVLTQKKEVCGPPVYLTTDWEAAKQSVQKLTALRPSIAGTGHGQPLHGSELAEGLVRLADNFDELSVPDYGKFTEGPDRK